MEVEGPGSFGSTTEHRSHRPSEFRVTPQNRHIWNVLPPVPLAHGSNNTFFTSALPCVHYQCSCCVYSVASMSMRSARLLKFAHRSRLLPLSMYHSCSGTVRWSKFHRELCPERRPEEIRWEVCSMKCSRVVAVLISRLSPTSASRLRQTRTICCGWSKLWGERCRMTTLRASSVRSLLRMSCCTTASHGRHSSTNLVSCQRSKASGRAKTRAHHRRSCECWPAK